MIQNGQIKQLKATPNTNTNKNIDTVTNKNANKQIKTDSALSPSECHLIMGQQHLLRKRRGHARLLYLFL